MKPIDAGKLRTPVTVIAVTKVKNASGFTETLRGDALGYTLYVQWKNAHGSEVLQAQQLGLRDRATLRCRYDRRITPACLIRKDGEDWEIISIDDIEERGTWMEIQVQRMEEAI